MTEEYDSPKTYIKEVKSINSLTDVDKIYAGQRIVIPYYSTELKQQLLLMQTIFLCYTVTRIFDLNNKMKGKFNYETGKIQDGTSKSGTDWRSC